MFEEGRDLALIRAVELYYYEGMTQAAISDRLGCTRWTVGRLLKEAADQGIVKVSIRHPQARSYQIEQQLVRAFSLRAARIVPSQQTRAENLTLVARTAASYLSDLRPRPQVVGVVCGRTTGTIARALADEWNLGVTVTQVCAAPSEVDDNLVGATVRIFAKRGHGIWKTIYSPVFADTPAKRQALQHDPKVAAGLHTAENADLIVYSPGVIGSDSALVGYSHQSLREIEELRAKGAVTTIANRYIDAAGKVVDPELDSRTVGMGLDELKRIRHLVAVGCGAEKRAGLAAALAGGYANTIITDVDTAEYLLDSGI